MQNLNSFTPLITLHSFKALLALRPRTNRVAFTTLVKLRAMLVAIEMIVKIKSDLQNEEKMAILHVPCVEEVAGNSHSEDLDDYFYSVYVY
jgi:hypothetical protein